MPKNAPKPVSGTGPHPPGRIRLRKYPNRRYYDTTFSRHLTLEGIYEQIRDGYEIEVSDSRTGEDITAKVLAQIILELDPPKLGVFPLAMLHRLLRSNEKLVSDFVDKYFNHPLSSFLDSQRNVEQYFRQAIGLHSPAPTVAEMARLMMSSFKPNTWSTAEHSAPAGSSGAASPRPASGPSEPDASSRVAQTAAAEARETELRHTIGELRAEVRRLRALSPVPDRANRQATASPKSRQRSQPAQKASGGASSSTGTSGDGASGPTGRRAARRRPSR